MFRESQLLGEVTKRQREWMQGLTGLDPPNYMLASDKNGGTGEADGVIDHDGLPGGVSTQFGGNHRSAGGNVLFVDSSVQWVTTASWKAYDTHTIGQTHAVRLSLF